MNITTKLKDNFLSFNQADYVKLFVSISAESGLVLLSFIAKNNAEVIKKHFKDFFKAEDNNLYLSENYNTPHLISEAFTFFAMKLEELEGIKMRHEQMLLQSDDSKYSLGYVDRSIIHIFGLKASGVHLNAYVEKHVENLDGQVELKKYLWIAKRSASKLHDPNKLDNLVAGAISLGYSNFETLQKEANEEAGILKELSKNASFDKALGYKSMQYGGLRNDVVNIYTLKLPESFTPTAVDGEVEEFFLVSAEELLEMLINNFDSFKYNSALVMLYFLASNGYVQQGQNIGQNIELSHFLNDLFIKLSL